MKVNHTQRAKEAIRGQPGWGWCLDGRSESLEHLYVGGLSCLGLICGHSECWILSTKRSCPPPVGCEAPNWELRELGCCSVSCPIAVVPATLLPTQLRAALWKSSLSLSHFDTLTLSFLTLSCSQPLVVRKWSSAEGGPQQGLAETWEGGYGKRVKRVSEITTYVRVMVLTSILGKYS